MRILLGHFFLLSPILKALTLSKQSDPWKVFSSDIYTRGPFLEGPEKFSGPERHNKNLNLMFIDFSHNFNTNKVNFHAKFNAYTLLSF